jgi:HTH-type transcriptional regulator/antitoxin HigA
VAKTENVEKRQMMKQQVRVIKTQRDYDAAVARLSALMDQEFVSGSNKEAELELLALVIESYERNKVEPTKPDPIEAILFRMDQQNLSKKDLIPYFGSLSKVSEVLSRKRSLSLAMIRKLHAGLGIPADVLIAGSDEEGVDLGSEPQYEYSKFPLQEMLERGYFAGFTGDLKRAKEYAEDLVRKFMRGIGGDSASLTLLRAPLHQNGSRLMDDYALLAWRIAVLSKARRQRPSKGYIEGTITADWLKDLAKLSKFEQGPRLAQEFLADSGIVLVIEEHFKKTYLDGAAMLDDELPIVALTLRHDRLDNFWFALMHELVHVQKHLKKNSSHLFIADNLDDKTRSSLEEREADDGAREALIPLAEWNSSAVKVMPTAENVIALANKLRIHPAIVAGRVRYETNNWRILNSLLGTKGEVRKNFENQLGGLQASTS